MRQCITCKIFKEETTDFYKQGKRNGKERNSYHTECKECTRLRTKANSSPIKKRYHMMHFKFGISKDQYDELVKKFPICAICGNEFKRNEPHLDHCHTTMKIRGLLCGGCNVGLGMFKDNPEIIQEAIKYLTKSLVADCPTITSGRVFQQLT